MKKPRVPLCLVWSTVVLGFLHVTLLAADTAANAPSRDALPTLFVCGDSTAARSRPPIQGWGEEIGAFFDPARIHLENRARGGRSARTFIAEGLWNEVLSQLRPGDIVLLQFGHNDSKSAMSLERYDLSGTGNEILASTDPRTGQSVSIHTFGHYLREMIDAATAKGAKVIVLSSVPRSRWSDGKIVRGEENHARWSAEVAKAAGVPFVDVNAAIADVYDRVGRARVKALYFPQDNTHTNPAGARLNAACVVAGLSQLNDPAVTGALAPDAKARAAAVVAAVDRAARDVRLALPTAGAFPAPHATKVCPDTPLRLTFTSEPALGGSGKIHIVDAETGADADTIDVGSPVATKTVGGEPNYRYYPVIISGTEATLYPRNGALKYGRTYYVTADAGVFTDGKDAYAGLTRADGWEFSTRPSAPPVDATRVTVAADGTGDFCTVQGAIDFIPEGNTTPRTIFLRKGTYTEIVFFTNKHALTLLGEDRKQSVIAYATNNEFNPTSGNPFGNKRPNPSAAHVGGNIYHRGVFLAHRVNDLVLANLTIRNTTPQGGSQAEAIILNGTTSARAILKDVDLYSYQDTLQINGQAYLSGCYIEGDVDFMWGTGPCFFDHCVCRSLRSGAYYTQIRNPATNHGYVYVNCTFDGIQGIMGNYLSRIGTGRFPNSEVVLIDCTLTPAVGPVAWQFQGGREGNERDAANVRFWEFNSHAPDGTPVDDTYRLPGSRRLREPADSSLIGHYRDPVFVLGDNWNPRSAPVFSAPAAAAEPDVPAIRIERQPVDRIALLETSASLTVVASATAGGRLSYQWCQNGHPLPGASSPTLRLPRVAWDHAAVYTVTIGNTAGRITSAAARLTVVAPQPTRLTPEAEGIRTPGARPKAPTAPDLPAIPEEVYDVTAFGAVADGATDNTSAIQKTIDTVLANGGGTVLVPAGEKPYLSGPLALGSNLNFEIAAGATLQLLPYSPEPKAGSYPQRGGGYPNFLTATGAHDIAITGAGTINGDGDAWWAAYRADRRMPHRPFLVRLNRCERVLVSGLTFTRSPMFHVAVSANHLTVFGITVNTPDGTPNTDGVDPAGSHHLIQNCAISCGDDNVVMKPGGTFCSDITVADCAFGEGHGMSVGGQSNRGLDGMTVKNCYFDGTLSALRLKADATQGGEVKNVTYTNLAMRRVQYPIVFYSYYKNVGNPAATGGNNKVTPDKVREWNANPPNPIPSQTMPSWKNITVSNVTSTETRGYSIIWGLPLEGYFIDNVKLANVRISGGPGLEVYDATNVQLTGDSDVGPLTVHNALGIVRQPQSQNVAGDGSATLSVATIGPMTSAGGSLTYQWTCNDSALTDESRGDGTVVSGAHSATLLLSHVGASAGGRYAVVVSGQLDTFDPVTKTIVPTKTPVGITSAAATITVGPSTR